MLRGPGLCSRYGRSESGWPDNKFSLKLTSRPIYSGLKKVWDYTQLWNISTEKWQLSNHEHMFVLADFFEVYYLKEKTAPKGAIRSDKRWASKLLQTYILPDNRMDEAISRGGFNASKLLWKDFFHLMLYEQFDNVQVVEEGCLHQGSPPIHTILEEFQRLIYICTTKNAKQCVSFVLDVLHLYKSHFAQWHVDTSIPAQYRFHVYLVVNPKGRWNSKWPLQ